MTRKARISDLETRHDELVQRANSLASKARVLKGAADNRPCAPYYDGIAEQMRLLLWEIQNILDEVAPSTIKKNRIREIENG